MELMQLEMFVAVVEERSFHRAAERVFRTQPAVSLALRKLEAGIGVPLLDRSHRRGARLTHAGEVLYEYARQILGLRNEALTALKGDGGNRVGTLRIGLTGRESFEWIPHFLKRFKGQFPNVRVDVACDRLATLFEELAERRLDLALVSGRAARDANGKDFLITRVRGVFPYRAFWVVRRRLRPSPLAHAFEESLMESLERPARTGNLKRIGLQCRVARKTCA